MPTGLTYDTYSAELALLSQFETSDPRFAANLPSAINYAEDRINRELNLLSTVAANSSLSLTAGVRSLDITAANINVLQDVNIITPAATAPDAGTRHPCTVVDKTFLNLVYNVSTLSGVPAYFSLLDNKKLLFGPWPDDAYQVELIGTVWPTPLSETNTTTWISTYLPDLFLAASMIWMAGFKMNFGAQADTPAQAMSWESQYTLLRDSAATEDARRKFQSAGWTSELPNADNPPRS